MGVGTQKYQIIVRNKTDSSTLVTVSNVNLFSGTVVDELSGEQNLTFTVNYATVTLSNFALGNIVRLNNTETSTYVTYRIMKRTRRRIGLKVVLEVYCEHLKYDLGLRVINAYKQFVQTDPQDILTWILAYSDSFTVGDVSDSMPVDFEIDYETCMDAINRLTEKTDYDWEVIADGGANHKKVYIRDVSNTTNGTPGTCSFSYGVNILSLSNEESLIDGFASRLIARGGASGGKQRTATLELYSMEHTPVMDSVGAHFQIYDINLVNGWITVKSNKLLTQDDALNGVLSGRCGRNRSRSSGRSSCWCGTS